MKNYRAVISYDGTNYFGFQRQKSTENTVQGAIERVLSKILDSNVRIVCAGRTDAGVHALGQVINFSVSTKIPEGRLKSIINKKLPESIRFIEFSVAGNDFHARKNAKIRSYIYKFYLGDCCFPSIDKYAYKLKKPLDLVKIEQACDLLLGTTECKSFMTNGSIAKSTVKNISKCRLVQLSSSESIWGANIIYYNFYIEADSFLYNMIRIITSNLLKIGYSDMEIEEFVKILKSCNRSMAGKMLPSNGLYLNSVSY